MSEHVKNVHNHDLIDEVLRDGTYIDGNMNFAYFDDNLFPELDTVLEDSPMPVPIEPTMDWPETMDLQQLPEFTNMQSMDSQQLHNFTNLQPLDSTPFLAGPVVEDAPSDVTITVTEAAVNWDSPNVTIEVQATGEEPGAASVPKEESSEESSQSGGKALSNPPKKRGRKRLYPPGTTPPRRRRPRKVKLYELETFEDPEMERKRQNALNAKIHREKQKEKKEALQGQLEAAIRDRDELKRQLEEMREREKKLVKELEMIRQQHNTPAVFPVKIIYWKAKQDPSFPSFY